MATKARLTADDLLRMPDDAVRELVNGEIVEMPFSNALHAKLTIRLGHRLAAHVDKHGGGEVFGGDVGVVLNLPYDPERVRGVDVAFVSSGRLPEGRLPEKFLQGAP